MRIRVAIFFLIGALFPSASFAASGTVLDTHPYAWSDYVGYINFSGVVVSDSALTGFAWSENKGFISLDPTQGGVFNDGTGNLSGSAWGEQLGWIDFGSVSINGSTGEFSGTATGTLVGTITFGCPSFCDVATDWRQVSSSGGSSGGGGGGGGGITNPIVVPEPPIPFEDIVEPNQIQQIDILEDGAVDILDFNLLMLNWGFVGAGNPADMNSDGAVDILDFNSLMLNWGATYLLTI